MPGLRKAKELTAADCDRAATDAQVLVLWDALVPGLGLRVQPTGKKTWFVSYRVAGDRTKRKATLGTYGRLRGQMPLAAAREKARVMVARAADGEDPTTEIRARAEAPLFAAFAADYLDKYARPRKRTWERDAEILQRDVLPAWGKRRITDITRRDVVDLIEGIRDRGAPIAANRTLALARKMFNWGIGRDLLRVNPCAQVEAVAKERKRDRWLSEGELRALWGALDAYPVKRTATLFRAMLLTAQRSGEVMAMAWADLDLQAGWWTIPAARSKNGLAHRVPLAPAVVALLDALPRTCQWVFPARVAPLPGQEWKPIGSLGKITGRICDMAGVDFTPHDLRRTAASWMTSLGVPRFDVAKILNHAEGGVTAVYDRNSYDQAKRQALELWAERLMAMVTPP